MGTGPASVRGKGCIGRATIESTTVVAAAIADAKQEENYFLLVERPFLLLEEEIEGLWEGHSRFRKFAEQQQPQQMKMKMRTRMRMKIPKN